MEKTDSYTIKLPEFEGPFDLLLFFIERDELDINDIPIANITNDFLYYIREMERLNVDLASEFIVVAASLCRIKAKMLLPRRLVDEEGNEIDPREELVNRLIEYKRYKGVLEEMRKMEEERFSKSSRGNITKELKQIAEKALVDVELESVTLFKLLRNFERLLKKYEDRTATKTVHRVMRWEYTIKKQQSYIFEQIEKKASIDFEELFVGLENRIHAIVTFLALLELLNTERLHVSTREGINNFWLSKRVNDSGN